MRERGGVFVMTRKKREKIAEVSHIVRYGLIGIYIIASIVYIWASAYPSSISNGCGRAQIEDTIWTATIILFGVGLCFLNYLLYLQAMYRIGLKYCCEQQHSYSKL